MYPQYPAVGYLSIKLQNSTWYKCLNLSLTVHTFLQMDVHSYARTYIRKTEKLYAPSIIRCGGIKISVLKEKFLIWSYGNREDNI